MRDANLSLAENEQRTIGSLRCDANCVSAAEAGLADRLLRGGKVGGRKHKAGTAALGQSGQRHFGIAPAQLVFGEEYELGAIRTGLYHGRAIGLGLDVAVDQARKVRG